MSDTFIAIDDRNDDQNLDNQSFDSSSRTSSQNEELDSENAPLTNSGWSRWIWRLALVLVVLSGLIWYLKYEAQRIPDFYAEVLDIEADKAEKDGLMFERQLIQLQNACKSSKPWKVKITQDQINGWFASDLPEKFPDSLPVDVKDPRVVLRHDKVLIAFKFVVGRFEAVVVATGNMFCTESQNEIAVELDSVKTGWLPLPIDPWLDKVGNMVTQSGLPIFWSKNSSKPVAIFTLPDLNMKKFRQNVIIEAIQVEPTELVFAGRTQRIQKKATTDPQNSDQN